MSLIIYPTADWDSFISVTDADIIIGGFVNPGTYLTLDEAGKEALLRQTALQIKLCSGITLPTTVESDLELAQCYLTVQASELDMVTYDDSGAITREKVDVLEVEYDVGYKTPNTTFNAMTAGLLQSYGCSGSRIVQTYLGRA